MPTLITLSCDDDVVYEKLPDLVDGPYNSFCEQGSSDYIPRGDPAPQSAEF
jgi:hypothetical protein